MNNSHLTAIKRRKVSAPIKELISQKYGSIFLADKYNLVLDYGCGRGFNADHFGWDKYDPYYFPEKPKNGIYDAVVCEYVLNVIETTKERYETILKVLDTMSDTGSVAFFIVRDDIRSGGYTSKGTYQCRVNLNDAMGDPLIYKRGKYIVYSCTASEREGVRNICKAVIKIVDSAKGNVRGVV